jgi:hypothetical protein
MNHEKYHYKLNLPVPLVFPQYPVPNPKEHYHCRFYKADMNKEFMIWVHSIGLYVIGGEFFYTPPFRTLNIHCDSPVIDDRVKLNWMMGGDKSTMDWYELKPDKNLITNDRTVIDTPEIKTGQYSYAERTDIKLTFSTEVGFPSLVNVGRLHGVRNGSEPRYVACTILGDPKTGKQLVWEKAKKIFQKYVV